MHVIIHNAARVKFTPNATVRDFQELKIHAEAVLYAPRSLDYLSVPNDRDSVSFSVDGMPAPHIEQLVRSKVRVRVDGGDQEAFINSGWRQTKVRFVVSSMFDSVGSAVALTMLIFSGKNFPPMSKG